MNHFKKILGGLLILSSVLFATGCKHPANTDKYTIHYESEYGTAPEDKTVEGGYILTEEDLPVLEADGYTFNGWDKEAGFEITEDVTITAAWTPGKSGNPDDSNQAGITAITIDFTEKDIEVTSAQNGSTITFTPETGYSDYTWTLNAKALDASCSVDSTTGTLTFDKSKAKCGIAKYTFTLKANKGGITYTTSIEISADK